jgi:hypothetical protein
VLALAAIAAADDAPRYGYAPAAPAYDEPAVYAYNYAVDDYNGAKYNAGEQRDGYATSGSYSVALPDGRLQTVNYKVADAYSGYVADVVYTGEAAYPAYSKPAYAPAPAPYVPAPAPAPYVPAPAPYVPAPAPYAPKPYAPKPYAPAPYKPAPVYA